MVQNKADVDWSGLIGKVASERDLAAFKTLFDHFAPRIKAWILKAGCTAEEAEEIAQSTMIALWRKASLFDPASTGAAGWIFTITRNQRIDLIRRRARERRNELMAEPFADASYVESAESLALQEDGARRVMDAVKKLTPEQSRVVRLSFIEERTHPEIADELKIPVGTVKSRIRLAMKRLKTLLENG